MQLLVFEIAMLELQAEGLDEGLAVLEVLRELLALLLRLLTVELMGVELRLQILHLLEPEVLVGDLVLRETEHVLHLESLLEVNFLFDFKLLELAHLNVPLERFHFLHLVFELGGPLFELAPQLHKLVLRSLVGGLGGDVLDHVLVLDELFLHRFRGVLPRCAEFWCGGAYFPRARC